MKKIQFGNILAHFGPIFWPKPTLDKASRLSEVVSALGSQPSDPGSIPGPRLVDRECDDNALKALLREPPCRTCKKDQAGIKVQDY